MKELRNNLSQQKGIAQVKVDQGLVTKSAFLELQVELERVEMNLASIRKDMDRERLMLEMWTGRRSGELKILLEKTLPPIKAFEIELGVPKDLLSRRPELQLAALHVVEKAQELSLSQKEMLPKLSLSGEVFFYGDSVDRWLTSDRAGFSFGPQLSWRLFEFGRIQQEKNAAAALYDEAVLAWRQAFRLAVKDVELSYERFQRDDQRWTSQQKIQKLREDKWIEDQTLLRFGRMAQAETLVSEQLLLQQKISSAEAFLQRQGSALKTQVSLGLPQHRLP
jgi:outer membrane protein TolC